LDNSEPDPVDRETISNPNPKNPNIRPDWTPKSGSCTPLDSTSMPQIKTNTMHNLKGCGETQVNQT